MLPEDGEKGKAALKAKKAPVDRVTGAFPRAESLLLTCRVSA